MDPNLIARIERYYHYLWSNRRSLGVADFVHDENLSFPMRAEISLQLKQTLLKNVLFRRWARINTDCLGNILLRLKVQIYLEGDVIFHAGSIGREMYFITKGTVHDVDENDNVLRVHTAGQYFGELSLLR